MLEPGLRAHRTIATLHQNLARCAHLEAHRAAMTAAPMNYFFHIWGLYAYISRLRRRAILCRARRRKCGLVTPNKRLTTQPCAKWLPPRRAAASKFAMRYCSLLIWNNQTASVAPSLTNFEGAAQT